MNKKILIDATFKEETRVVLLENNVLINLDREVNSIKKLKGNIYLAKVIRVEPSLQAAFINYGGDRHGFIPFSDIHPDYYNIDEKRKTDLSAVKFFNAEDKDKNIQLVNDDDDPHEASAEDFQVENFVKLDENHEPIINEEFENSINDDINNSEATSEEKDSHNSDCKNEDDETTISNTIYKNYKIENVIKEGQYLLVKVIKEERGEKGVALTTYISMAGKYCVLMGNVEGKGGISKKITNLRDRKILKNILHSLNPENDKSVIIRTAGVGKKPEEILKDYVYLVRLWNGIKTLCLELRNPAFIHSEDDIIKRTIRELCDDNVDEIIVEGDETYKNIRALIKTIIPEYKINIKLYNDKIPLFFKYNVEDQIGNLFLNKIPLSSGGSIVIDQTEALVAIDVNSGKATKEKSIEETAVMINVEAAKEIAKQLRLRDIGGLIVIDFIDMFDNKNKRLVERTLRDATLIDKARIQIEKLSNFGLIEMSRQRLNASFIERVSETCPFCEGRGMVKSKSIMALNLFRAIKYTARDKACKIMNISVTADIMTFVMNYKMEELTEIEKNYGIKIFLFIDKNLKDNDFDIKKRQVLTEEEKINLNLSIQKGKLNDLFNDDEMYLINKEENEKYEFNDNCYFDKSETNNHNIIKRPKKRMNTNTNNNKKPTNKVEKKKGVMEKIFSLFK